MFRRVQITGNCPRAVQQELAGFSQEIADGAGGGMHVLHSFHDQFDVADPDRGHHHDLMITDPSELWTIQERGIPLVMNNTLTILEDRVDEYVQALKEVLPLAHAEAGCHYLQVGALTRRPNVFVLSEGWRDLVEYRDEILAKDYFQKYLGFSESVYAEPL